VQRFGSHAGWAHNTLFIAELKSHQVWGRGVLGAARPLGGGVFVAVVVPDR
jgi:hypothetical protein